MDLYKIPQPPSPQRQSVNKIESKAYWVSTCPLPIDMSLRAALVLSHIFDRHFRDRRTPNCDKWFIGSFLFLFFFGEPSICTRNFMHKQWKIRRKIRRTKEYN